MVYPKRCVVCGDIVTNKKNKVCSKCYKALPWIVEPTCKRCGKPVEGDEIEFCYDCSRRQLYYEYGFSLWKYSSNMRQSIAYFKYHNRKEYGKFYGEEFVRVFGNELLRLEPDALIPVPIHWTRYIQRGYNQTEVIAKEIGKRLDIPVVDDLLVRRRKTVAQKKLDDKERAVNLRQAFSISRKWQVGSDLRKVVIVDDIYTTGNTINMCAKVLKEYGIEKVYFGVLCIGAGF